ncbi:MAG: OpgC family protein [Acetobacteraceae bacterium]
MNRFWTHGWSIAGSRRDPRVDILRGISLLMIFVDHIANDWLGNLTLRNFGFCDAAEIFVLLAGFASMSAYGKRFEREGPRSGLNRLGARCIRLYIYQLGLLVGILVIRRLWFLQYGFGTAEIASLFDDGMRSLGHILTLHSLPPGLDILPLYIVLLTCFPLVYAAIRLAGPAAALAASGLLWAIAVVHPGFNLVNAANGTPWHFDPFAWQFLFAIGAVLALAMNAAGGDLPRRRWLVGLACAYLGFAFLEAAPWSAWGLPSLAPIGIGTPDKTTLAPVRLLDVLALLYLVLSSPRLAGLARRPVFRLPVFRLLEACGRNSLEVFSLGTLLSLIGELAMKTWGTGPAMQVAVNLAGFAAMIALALALEHGVRLPVARAPVTRAPRLAEQAVRRSQR